MNDYLIEKKLINELINPYEKNLLNINPIITHKEIERALNDTDVIEIMGDDERINAIRKIALLVINSELLSIKIDFNNSIISVNNPYILMACLYHLNGNMLINVTGDIPQSLSEKLIITENNTDFNLNDFEWDKTEDLLDETWNNKKFIMDFLKSNPLSFEDVYKFSPLEIWDKEFLININKNFPSFLLKSPIEFLYKDAIFELMKEIEYENILIKFTKDFILTSFHSKNQNIHKSIIESLQKNEKEFNQEIIRQNSLIEISEKFKEKYINEILNNKDCVIRLLSRTEVFLIYKYLHSDLKSDKEILETLLRTGATTNYKYFDYYIDKALFKDEDFLKQYISKILRYNAKIDNDSYIYENWINNKDKIIEYSKLTHNTTKDSYSYKNVQVEPDDPFLKFFSVLPKKMKKDIDILKIFIEKDPKIYNNLSETLRKNKTLLITYISADKWLHVVYKHEKIPTDLLLSLNREELKKVLTKMPEIILRNEKTMEWLKVSELVACLGKKLKEFTISEEIWEQVCKDEQNCMKIIEENITNYYLLTLVGKLNINVAMSYIKLTPISIVKTKIPKILWWSINFCIKVIEYNNAYISEVPKNLWNNKDFVLRLASSVDQGLIPISIFNNGPSRINQIINSYQLTVGRVTEFLNIYIKKNMLDRNLLINDIKKNNTRNKI